MASRAIYPNVTMTAVGTSTPIVINLAQFHYGVGIIVHIYDGASALYDVQVTGWDPTDPAGLRHWNLHDILQGMSTSGNSNLLFPVTAVRLNVQSISTGGSVFMSVVQAGG